MSSRKKEDMKSSKETTKKTVIDRVIKKEADKGRLPGKIALVTGGGSGIGRAIALRFAEEGAKVCLTYNNNREGAEQVTREIEGLGGTALAVQLDVKDVGGINKVFEETSKNLGNIEILVNNAGTYSLTLVRDMTPEQLQDMFRVHVEGTIYCSKAAVKSMKEGGRIINMSSITALSGDIAMSHYRAAKSAIMAFTKSLALEVARKGITVNAIAPGVIATPMSKMMNDVAPDFTKNIPIPRLGTPEEVASLAVFLASSEASYITGGVFVVDGGLSLYTPMNQTLYKLFLEAELSQQTK